MFGNLVQNLSQPVFAGVSAGAINYFMEGSPEYQTKEAYLTYAGIVAASNLVGSSGVEMVLPHFKNASLLNLQKIVLSSATTGGLNVAGQSMFNNDARVPYNLAVGAASGLVAPVVSHYVSNLWSDY